MKNTYKLLLSLMILVSTNLYSQLSISISQVKLNSLSVPANTAVNIGTSETGTVEYLVTVTKDNNTTYGNCLLSVGRYKGNTFITQVITPEMIYYGPNNVGSQGTYSFVIADYNLGFNCNEDYFQAKIEQTDSPFIAATSNKVFLTRTPRFSVSQSQSSVSCNQTTPVNFNITSNNSDVTYSWNVGSGWINSGASTGSSISLIPLNSNLQTVYLTANYNCSQQSSFAFNVSRSSFVSSAILSGNIALCPTSIQSVYTLSNAGTGNTVNWSLSNNAIASILSYSNNSATVKGLQNGNVTLTATITNACNQQVVRTYNINVIANAGQITAPISYVTNTNFLNYCMNPQNTNTCGFQNKTIVSTANNLKPIKFDMSLQLGNASIQQLVDPIAYNYVPTAETRYSGDIYGKFYSSPIVVSVKANYACNISSGNFVTYMSLMGVANKISQTNNSYEIRISPNKAKDFVTITKEDFDIPYLKVVDKYLNREVSDAELEIMKNEISVLEKSINQKTIVKLFDFNSKEIFTTEMTTNELEINVSKFAKGLYIINVERGIEKVTQKLIIE